MVASIRDWYNSNFSPNVYKDYVQQLSNLHADALQFRIAETPIFVDKAFTNKMLDTCEAIVDVIKQPSFLELTDRAVPQNLHVPGDIHYPQFICFDFGICENSNGELEPQLIEMQGFPSLFAYQVFHAELTRQLFNIPANYDTYLNGFTKETYIQLLKEIIVGDDDPKHSILLEVLPHQQKTRIDFYCTEDYLDVPVVCLTELIKEGKEIFYKRNGEKIKVKRIYNRVIFDDLQQQTTHIQEKGKILFEEADVLWIPHPDWFYRISKFTLPFIHHAYVPETTFLSDIKEMPVNLDEYVLKPLFSFAGQGVVIDVTPNDIDSIIDKENWILQRKVKYADVIKTPDVPAKAEIRIFYFWKEGDERPVATHNLARLSKGQMIGVRYNKDKEWVGGSLAYFEK